MSWGELQGKNSGTNSSGGQAFTGPVTIDANSASDALRVTQTGAGNAILVEDSANPDSSPFVVTTSGVVGIGTTPSATISGLHVAKTITGGTGMSSIIQAGVIQSDVTSSASGYVNNLTTQAATFTLANYYGYLAQQGTIGAGTTISNQSGFIAGASLVGASTNFGFNSALPVGGGRWNFYAAGTARNFLAGRLDIGGTARTTTLAPSVTNPLNFLSSAVTITDDATAASGTVSWAPVNSFDNPTLAASNASVTYTNAATVYIDGPPVAGTNVTITNPYSLFVADGRSTFNNSGTGATVSINRTGTGFGLNVSGAIGFGAPVTKTADFTVGDAENSLINNKSGSTCTVTLPTIVNYLGRVLLIKTIQAQQVVSASSNVVPLEGGSAGTVILPAIAGAWAKLICGSTNWEVMESGVSTTNRGTYATMAALTPATGTYFLATDYGQYGLEYRFDGTNWRLRGQQQGVFLLPAPISYVAPDTQATASQTNAGNTQVTAALHLLTSTPAVGAYVNVSAWGGGAPVATTGLKKILTVDDANNFTLDVPYNADNGTPTLTLKNVQVTLASFSIPPLLDNSRFRAWPQWGFTSSTNSKRVKIILGTTELYNNNNTTTGVTLITHGFGFSNYGAKTSQRSFYGLANSTGFGGGASTTVVTASENTAVSLTVKFDVLPAVANEVISLDGLDCYLVI